MTLSDYIGTRWQSGAGLEFTVSEVWTHAEHEFAMLTPNWNRGAGRSVYLHTLLREYKQLSPSVSDDKTGGSQ